MASRQSQIPMGYFEIKVSEDLAAQGLSLGDSPSDLEIQLMRRLLLVSGAAEAVLSDVDDDGVAEADDMAVSRLRKALIGQRQGLQRKRTRSTTMASSRHASSRGISVGEK